MQYLKGVSTLKLNESLCKGCGMCTIVCPHGVFEIQNHKASIHDIDACMECGACAMNCRYGAIMVHSGVGCAAAIINGMLSNSAPDCGCSQPEESSCC